MLTQYWNSKRAVFIMASQGVLIQIHSTAECRRIASRQFINVNMNDPTFVKTIIKPRDLGPCTAVEVTTLSND